MRTKIGIATLGLVSAMGWASGQKPPPKPPAAAPKDFAKPNEAFADFDAVDPNVNNKTGITTGRDFTYKEEDTVVTGRKVRQDRNIKHLFGEGELVLDNLKQHVVGDKADVDYGKKGLAIITGSVIITIKPKQETIAPADGTLTTPPVSPPQEVKKENKEDVSSARGRGVVITCDRVESLYRKKQAKIYGKEVRFTQKLTKPDGTEVERVVIAEHAEYDGKKDILILFAPVKATDTDGQVMNFSENVIVGTKEGNEALESKGRVTGIVKIDKEEDDTEEKPTPPQNKPPR